MKFLDISDYNNVNDYSSLSKQGLGGVIIKASEGTTYTETTFEDKYNVLKELGVNLGAYHYLTSTSNPETQAQHFYELVKDKTFQILPVLDVEQGQLGNKAENYSARFMNEFYALGGSSMIIYSGRCFIEENFSSDFCSNNVFWVADYSNTSPTIEKCGYIIAWQYTESCTDYSCVDGGVDCSILYDEDRFYSTEIPFSDSSSIASSTTYVSIADLQTELNNQGFTDCNGNSVQVDNVAGVLTLSACPTIQEGASGNITKWLQTQLDVSVDGIFGTETYQAVLTYQYTNNLVSDGIVGQGTWSKLMGL